MGLTRRKDSYYVEFSLLYDGEVLNLASGGRRAAETLKGRLSEQDGSQATGGDSQNSTVDGTDS